jgi:phospholipid/cholesterol/gamma-HCH transport system substrate-binding protein
MMSTYSRGYDLARIGAMGLLAIAAFVGLFLYVTNRGLAMTRTDLYVRMPVASGLSKGDPVLFRGVQVGEVKRISFTPEGQVLVLARLTESVPLTRAAHAELVPIDLFGRQSVVLEEGTHHAPSLASRDTVPGVQASSMTAQVAELGVRAETLLSDSMVALLRETLAGSAAATQQIAALGTSMNRLVGAQHDNLTALTAEAAAIGHNLEIATAPAELEATRGSLAHATARLDTATIMLTSVLGGIDRGEGSAGMLLRDEALYRRTESLLASLEELARDFKVNPRKYINLEIF